MARHLAHRAHLAPLPLPLEIAMHPKSVLYTAAVALAVVVAYEKVKTGGLPKVTR